MKLNLNDDAFSRLEIIDSVCLNQAIESVKSDGYIVLDDFVRFDSLDILLEQMTADTNILLDSQKNGRILNGWKHAPIQQKPPHHPPFLFSDIVANPYVVQVTYAVLGDGLFNSFYSGNTNCPGSEQQPIHRDAVPL